MANLRIKVACVRNDRTSAVLDGVVKLDGVEFDPVEFHDVVSGFTSVYRGEFDVGEFSTTELIYFCSRNKSDLVGIPVFPLRSFRHSYVFCNTAANISGPKSLSGKTIGFGEWVQTAAVWVRGILAEEYGLVPAEIIYRSPAIHHWGSFEDKDQITPRDGSVIDWVDALGQNRYEFTDRQLLEGKTDALVFPRAPASMLRGDKRVKRLFENYREVEAVYFQKTRIFPIMHTLVMKRSLAEKHPDLPAKLFKLFCQAKKIGRESAKSDRSGDLVWKDYYLEEEKRLFGGDPWAYGLKQNEHVLEKLISYCYAQGIAAERVRPKDLFVPDTWELEDSDSDRESSRQ